MGRSWGTTARHSLPSFLLSGLEVTDTTETSVMTSSVMTSLVMVVTSITFPHSPELT